LATILVVDDEPDIRTLVGLELRLDGHQVLEAGDGEQALAAVAEHHPDLVILDVLMPLLSGWDVLMQLKADADPAVREIPVILLTVLTGPIERARGGIEGAVHHLDKPIGSHELRQSVREALAGGPEPEQRRRAQQRALEDLARMERGGQGTAVATGAPRPRLTGLESSRPADRNPGATTAPDLTAAVAALTDKQRELLAAVRAAPTVMEAAANVYASLRRITRRLQVRTVSDLLSSIRSGRLTV
jgi:two-component system, OmpR family, alkaline phosphatase synthesis response regulator PhoP